MQERKRERISGWLYFTFAWWSLCSCKKCGRRKVSITFHLPTFKSLFMLKWNLTRREIYGFCPLQHKIFNYFCLILKIFSYFHSYCLFLQTSVLYLFKFKSTQVLCMVFFPRKDGNSSLSAKENTHFHMVFVGNVLEQNSRSRVLIDLIPTFEEKNLWGLVYYWTLLDGTRFWWQSFDFLRFFIQTVIIYEIWTSDLPTHYEN